MRRHFQNQVAMRGSTKPAPSSPVHIYATLTSGWMYQYEQICEAPLRKQWGTQRRPRSRSGVQMRRKGSGNSNDLTHSQNLARQWHQRCP